MRSLFIILIPFLLFACYPNTPFELDAMTPVPVRTSYISLQDNRGLLLEIGSAVVIGDGYAITCRHVIEGFDGMKGYMAGGVEFPVTEVLLSDSLDLALFEIPKGAGEPLKIGKRVVTGEHIFSVGTSKGSTIYEGIVRETDLVIHHVDIDLMNPSGRDEKGRPETHGFLCEGDFKKGFSGGPVVNSRGELVGIIQGSITELLSESNEEELKTTGTYGTAYHIADIMDEVKRMTGKGLK
jgi:S1-C subfamily serine protease